MKLTVGKVDERFTVWFTVFFSVSPLLSEWFTGCRLLTVGGIPIYKKNLIFRVLRIFFLYRIP